MLQFGMSSSIGETDSVNFIRGRKTSKDSKPTFKGNDKGNKNVIVAENLIILHQIVNIKCLNVTIVINKVT